RSKFLRATPRKRLSLSPCGKSNTFPAMRASFPKKNKEAGRMRDTGATWQWSDAAVLMVLITMLALTGCVTKESYTQQVNRTTNLQRLLAEEEKGSSDLVNDVARLKSQVNDLEAQNKVISDQLKESR